MGIPIPNFIGSLNKLTYLNLSNTFFNGKIPPHLGNLSNLLYLDLSHAFSTNFPTASNINWLSGLSSLKYLNLNYVDLSEATTDWLQTVNLLPSLLELHLFQCELHYLPQSFTTVNFTSLSVLDLSFNDFYSSSIPQWVFNFTSLTKLQLISCNLAGSIPKIAKGDLCKLQTLDLSINNLSGEITEFFQALSECSNSSLEELYLGDNQLIENIPHSLGNLKRLRELQLDGNAFSGSIPSSIQNLSRLEILSLSYNKMNGTIPESIGQLSELRELHLSWNYWQGSIPSCFGGLAGYKYFDGTTFGKITEHMDLVVKGRQYEFYDQISNVNLMDFSKNSLSGEIPTELTNLTLLNSLNLSQNHLTGMIPENIGALRQLESLDLSSNHLSGNPELYGPPPLPTSVSTLSDRNAEHKYQEDVHVHIDGEDQFEKL
nr:probable LRR receptor-like serine/threonine-protein kinase At1g34110 [Quercus suber]